jgi:hypothetical protein
MVTPMKGRKSRKNLNYFSGSHGLINDVKYFGDIESMYLVWEGLFIRGYISEKAVLLIAIPGMHLKDLE